MKKVVLARRKKWLSSTHSCAQKATLSKRVGVRPQQIWEMLKLLLYSRRLSIVYFLLT